MFWHLLLEAMAWLVALSWVIKVVEAAVGLPHIVDLRDGACDLMPAGTPSLAVIVPARNEGPNVAACLLSLIEQDYPNLRIIAVNDRSTDDTGHIMQQLAGIHSKRLRMLSIEELPGGWLGKTHAMSTAADLAVDAEWLLFTDADVVFRSDALRRSLAYAVGASADHLVTMPTTIIRRWDEGMLLGFLQIFGMWATRPWKVADPKAKRDAIGIGAFNLVRRSVYEQVGGFASIRMAVIEDLGLARRIKRAGFAQRIAFGQGLVNIHWASGSMGLVRVMTKNMFSAFNFHLTLTAIACLWVLVFCVAPIAGLFFAGFQWPSLIVLLAMATAYRLYGRTSGISSWQVLLSPVAALLLLYAVFRSVAVTLWRGGIIWRGTFYSLVDLRKNMPPFV